MAAQNIPDGLPADLFPPLSSLPFYVLKEIVEYVGDGDVNQPEDYGASLVVMLELFPCL